MVYLGLSVGPTIQAATLGELVSRNEFNYSKEQYSNYSAGLLYWYLADLAHKGGIVSALIITIQSFRSAAR